MSGIDLRLENVPRFENEEQELRWLLTEMHRDYQTRIAPVIKRLGEIEAAKPFDPTGYMLNYEQFKKDSS